MFSAEVHCEPEQVEGWARARAVSVDGITVAEAATDFRVYRDPDRGMVARVEAVVRGVSIDRVVTIDTIRAVAESWANGRATATVDPELERSLDLVQPESDTSTASRDGGNPHATDFNPENCDFSRTAGTCYERHLFGVRTPFWSCGPCGDEQAAVTAMQRALGANARVRLREPDPVLARGADNGYQAGIQKPDFQRFADLVLNDDLLQTTVPALEIVRYTPTNAPGAIEGGRGQQIYQFAGVEVSSAYGIDCLLVYDASTNTCAPRSEEAASLTIKLRDLEGQPLAGGAFEIRGDQNGDGVLGVTDELVPGGACATGPDGVGSCRFENLEPGAYLVTQRAAPPGYTPSDDPFAVALASGDDRTVTFNNAPSVSIIEITIVDPDDQPVAGAEFAVYPQDADGTVLSELVTSCVTDEAGTCRLEVEPGSFVLRQVGGPEGLRPIDPIPFEITQAGQTATVTLTLASVGGTAVPVEEPAPAAAPLMFSDPASLPIPVESHEPPPISRHHYTADLGSSARAIRGHSRPNRPGSGCRDSPVQPVADGSGRVRRSLVDDPARIGGCETPPDARCAGRAAHMRTLRLALGLAIAFLALAGCGSRALPDDEPIQANPTPSEESREPIGAAGSGLGALVQDGTAEPPITDGEGEPLPTDGPASETNTPSNPALEQHNTVASITLSTQCARPGDTVVASVSGPPEAHLVMTVAYRDGNPRGTYIGGQTDSGGTYAWEFVVASTAPDGPAGVYAMLTGPDGEKHGGGSASAEFVVEASGQCG